MHINNITEIYLETPNRQEEGEKINDREVTWTFRIKAFAITFVSSFLVFATLWALYSNRRWIVSYVQRYFSFFGRHRSQPEPESPQRERIPIQTAKSIDELVKLSEMEILLPTPIPSMITFGKTSQPNLLCFHEVDDRLDRIHTILATLEHACTSTTAQRLWDEVTLLSSTYEECTYL